MKKEFLVIFLSLLLANVVYANEFNFNREEIQLGDTFTISGNLYKDGFVIFNFLLNGNLTYTAAAPVKNGELIYSYIFSKKADGDYFEPGIYIINAILNDGFGNEILLENIGSVEIIDKLKIKIDFESEILPGNSLSINGGVSMFLDEPVNDATLVLTFDGKESYSSVENGIFSYSVPTSKNISSGEHEFNIKITDIFGNHDELTEKFFIKAVPTDLRVKLNSKEFSPKSKIEITPLIYDQAGDLIDKGVLIALQSPEEEVLVKNIKTNETLSYEFDDYALPGEWFIKVVSGKLSTVTSFNVTSVKNIDVNLNGQILVIKNLGNDVYDKEIVITFNDETVSKRLNLNPKSSLEIDLGKEVSYSGIYDIKVEFDGLEKIYEKVTIKKDNSFLFALLIFGLILGGGGFFFLKLQKRSKYNLPTKKTHKKSKLFSFKEKIPKYGIATEEDKDDFRKRVMEDIKRYQSSMANMSLNYNDKIDDVPVLGSDKTDKNLNSVKIINLNEKKEEDKKKNMFNLFD